jgi:hypothetical protein
VWPEIVFRAGSDFIQRGDGLLRKAKRSRFLVFVEMFG